MVCVCLLCSLPNLRPAHTLAPPPPPPRSIDRSITFFDAQIYSTHSELHQLTITVFLTVAPPSPPKKDKDGKKDSYEGGSSSVRCGLMN